MKKTYSKPEINFDSFGMTSNFALCAYTADSQTRGNCGYTIAGRTIFVAADTGCVYVSADGAFGVCYYVPTADSTIFQS